MGCHCSSVSSFIISVSELPPTSGYTTTHIFWLTRVINPVERGDTKTRSVPSVPPCSSLLSCPGFCLGRATPAFREFSLQEMPLTHLLYLWARSQLSTIPLPTDYQFQGLHWSPPSPGQLLIAIKLPIHAGFKSVWKCQLFSPRGTWEGTCPFLPPTPSPEFHGPALAS